MARKREPALAPINRQHGVFSVGGNALIEAREQIQAIAIQIARLEMSKTIQQKWDGDIGEYVHEAFPEIDVPAVKAAIDARFKLLNKVLPDLKQVEMKIDADVEQVTTSVDMSDTELVNRLFYYLNQAEKGTEAEQEAGDEEFNFL
jgi:hypothetical protein